MRTPYGLALAAAALSTLPFDPLPPIISLAQAPSSGVPDYHRKIHRSRFTPHQGKRECARRIRQGLCPS